ncbi:phage tail tube protein [Varibaculum prostatecancerukia]|uniref:phage tail tube protein n=1 Tax=Varibaculum prostatecancerukia TaxID=2811781 RepID=UPI001C000E08|nr:hypothetical protein [Varibaculum prostatecancerukia]
MANQKYVDTDHLLVPGRGTVLFAEPGQAMFKLEGFDKAKPDSFASWNLLGGTSKENMPAFDKDGGDATQLGIWEEDAVYTTYEATSMSVTLNAVRIDKETFELAFPGGVWDEATGSYKINGIGSVEKALAIVMFDGQKCAAFYMPRVSLSVGDMPELDNENFLEAQISGQILTDQTQHLRLQVFRPRPLTAAAPASSAGGSH